MNTKSAILGTDAVSLTGSEREMLLSAVTQGLRQQAGYVPERGVFVDDGTAHKHGELIPLASATSDTRFLDGLAAFCAGWGWIAGSAALWRYLCDIGEFGWYPEDIDVFCYTESSYQQLRDTLQKAYIQVENERSVKVSGFGYIVDGRRWWVDTPINFVKPLPSDNWRYPQNVLAGFDLTCCAVAITQPGAVFALHPKDVREKLINYTGQTISPAATVRRVFKYMNRGFKASWWLWRTMAQDEQMLPIMAILNELWLSYDEKVVVDAVRDVYRAFPDGTVYTSHRDDDDDYDDY